VPRREAAGVIDDTIPDVLVLALYFVAVNAVAMFLPPRQDDAAFLVTWLAAIVWIMR